MIYSPIGEDYWGDGSVVDPRAVAKALRENKGVKNVSLRINSPGGSAFHAFAIYELLKSFDAKVTAKIDGIAASAATIVMMAADDIEMNSAALIMIHRASVGAFGHAEDLRQTAEIGDKIDQSMAKIYAARTGLAESEIVAMLFAETWMTAEEAKAKNFISSISAAKTVAAKFGDNQFQNVPGRIQPLLAQLHLNEGKPPMTTATETPKTVDTPAPVPAPAAPPAVATATATTAAPAAAQTIDVEKIKADAKAEAMAALAEERKRAADINALCQQAGKSDLAAGFIEQGTPVADVQSKLFTALCEDRPKSHQPALPKEPETPEQKENAKFLAEYKANPHLQKAMTEAEYVATRRIDEGLEVLDLAKPK
jgi:ATP-dependent protease ClpP protease subunit